MTIPVQYKIHRYAHLTSTLFQTCQQGLMQFCVDRHLHPVHPSAMGEIAGANTAPLGGCLHSTKTRARLAEGFHELNGLSLIHI